MRFTFLLIAFVTLSAALPDFQNGFTLHVTGKNYMFNIEGKKLTKTEKEFDVTLKDGDTIQFRSSLRAAYPRVIRAYLFSKKNSYSTALINTEIDNTAEYYPILISKPKKGKKEKFDLVIIRKLGKDNKTDSTHLASFNVMYQ